MFVDFSLRQHKSHHIVFQHHRGRAVQAFRAGVVPVDHFLRVFVAFSLLGDESLDLFRGGAQRVLLHHLSKNQAQRHATLGLLFEQLGRQLVRLDIATKLLNRLNAQAIHFIGNRRHSPFVAINCAALPETLLESDFFGHERGAFTGAHALARGKFELADHGTLFLDEVGDMPMSLQVKLLRVLQEQRFARVGGEKEITVDVRVIAATNRDLHEAVRQKAFREDLYYRLNVIPISLPPLRERRADIQHLIEYFLNKFAKRHHIAKLKLTDAQLQVLKAYNWPGNIRELQNAIEKATVLQDVDSLVAQAQGIGGGLGVLRSAVPGDHEHAAASALRPTPSNDEYLLDLGASGSVRELDEVASDAQRAAVIRALKICKGNKSEAAKRLGISYKTLFNKIDDLGIQISTNVE